MKKYVLMLFFAALGLTGCKTPTVISKNYAYNNFGIECMGSDLDGSQTMRSWGKGKNKKQAIEQARKNAVYAVLFKGVHEGTVECNKRPVLAGANAYEKNEEFFNRFFADDGDFKQFTSLQDEKTYSRMKSSDSSIENWGIVVRVDRAGLRKFMIDRGILKQ